MLEIIKIHFKHWLGKYGPWYWIRLWLLCRDRSAAARRCACECHTLLLSLFPPTNAMEISKFQFWVLWGKILPLVLIRSYISFMLGSDRSVAALCCTCRIFVLLNIIFPRCSTPFRQHISLMLVLTVWLPLGRSVRILSGLCLEPLSFPSSSTSQSSSPSSWGLHGTYL